ncbi:MAG TPA: SAM-dependent methyltransferase [Phycisphaeraceae bacterium]
MPPSCPSEPHSSEPPTGPYVSRGGLKLQAALNAWHINPTGMTCADLGCSTGGFTDCLLQHGAAKVYAVDTAYGQLAWKLRQNPRVVVLERTNALHADPRETIADFPGCDLVTLDLGWTRQQRAVPAALRWLREEPSARIITLIKPHYEASRQALRSRRGGVLSSEQAQAVLQRVLDELPTLGVTVLACMPSPIVGGKGGNVEYLALLARANPPSKAT